MCSSFDRDGVVQFLEGHSSSLEFLQNNKNIVGGETVGLYECRTYE